MDGFDIHTFLPQLGPPRLFAHHDYGQRIFPALFAFSVVFFDVSRLGLFQTDPNCLP